jgi:hypothetical protein
LGDQLILGEQHLEKVHYFLEAEAAVIPAKSIIHVSIIAV